MKHFTAVNTLLVSTKRTKKGGFANVKFQLTAKITKALDWPEMPDGTAEWCPDVDELAAQTIEFVPNNPELNHNAVSIEAMSIGDFVVVRKHKTEGKNAVKATKTITEVLCLIKFQDPTGCAKLEQYMQGAKRSEMKVSYTPQPKQDELPGTRVDMSDDSQLPLTPEAKEAANDTPETDPNAEYVERAKERMAKRGRPAKDVQ
ncbi:MAG: hypothetical protein WAN65_10120 [Candidatus Sulfotelmatobacter sp.]